MKDNCSHIETKIQVSPGTVRVEGNWWFDVLRQVDTQMKLGTVAVELQVCSICSRSERSIGYLRGTRILAIDIKSSMQTKNLSGPGLHMVYIYIYASITIVAIFHRVQILWKIWKHVTTNTQHCQRAFISIPAVLATVQTSPSMRTPCFLQVRKNLLAHFTM